MAGAAVTITRKKIGALIEMKFVWLSDDAAGTVTSAATGNVYTAHQTVGKAVRLTTIPGAGGLAPTDDYDITILDHNGIDILKGLGADRDTANTEHKLDTDGLLYFMATSLTLTVAAAGNANGGTVLLYVIDGSDDPL